MGPGPARGQRKGREPQIYSRPNHSPNPNLDPNPVVALNPYSRHPRPILLALTLSHHPKPILLALTLSPHPKPSHPSGDSQIHSQLMRMYSDGWVEIIELQESGAL